MSRALFQKIRQKIRIFFLGDRLTQYLQRIYSALRLN